VPDIKRITQLAMAMSCPREAMSDRKTYLQEHMVLQLKGQEQGGKKKND
jgi:hypothetical protein